MTEEWREVPSLPAYQASSEGRVMRVPFTGSMPNGSIRRYGGKPTARVTHPYNNNRPTILFKNKNYRISRLVCEAFHGPAPFPRAVVMHIDDDQTNNLPSNLKWGTQKENLNTPKFLAYCRARTKGDLAARQPTTSGRRRRSAL